MVLFVTLKGIIIKSNINFKRNIMNSFRINYLEYNNVVYCTMEHDDAVFIMTIDKTKETN